jgi:hypothetical protein
VMGWCRSGGTDLVVWLEVRGEVMGVQAKKPKRSCCGSISGVPLPMAVVART